MRARQTQATHRRRARGLATAALVIALAAATLAHASEESRRLWSRGLIDFNSGRYPAALTLFDKAVQADGRDAMALYYRGTTRGKLGDLAGAQQDLEAALTLEPEMKEADLELGIVLVDAGEFAAAKPHLERARTDPKLQSAATFFLGTANLSLNDLPAARENFAAVEATQSPEATSAKYYLGVIAFKQGDRAAAVQYFQAVSSSSPGSEMGQQAQKMLAGLEGHPGAGRPWEVFGQVGFEYDTNVALAPNDQVVKGQLGIGKQNDGRAALGAGVAYVPWRNENVQFSLGYEFYQTLQFDLTDFNLQDHRPSIQIAGDAGFAQWGFFGRYDYYRMGGSNFLSQGTMEPFVLVPEADFGRTELFYRAQGADFLAAPYEGVLDGWTQGPGLRQFVYFGVPDLSAFLGYRFSQFLATHVAGDPYEYNGNEVDAGAVLAFDGGYSAEVTYAFRYEGYGGASGGRIDRVNLAEVALRWQFAENFAVTAAFLGHFNDSNQADFDYNRQIGSIMLQARY